jgi:alpha-beta hydrolase superfamily lysophospholipase
MPTFLALAQNDRIIDNLATRELSARFPGGTSIVEYPNAHHTLEFEPETQQWVDDVTKWIVKQTD